MEKVFNSNKESLLTGMKFFLKYYSYRSTWGKRIKMSINTNSKRIPLHLNHLKWAAFNHVIKYKPNTKKKYLFFLISGQTMSVSSFKKLEPEEYLRQHYQQGLRPDGRKGLSSLRCEIFVFSPLVPSKSEKNVIVLYDKIHNYVFLT